MYDGAVCYMPITDYNKLAPPHPEYVFLQSLTILHSLTLIRVREHYCYNYYCYVNNTESLFERCI